MLEQRLCLRPNVSRSVGRAPPPPYRRLQSLAYVVFTVLRVRIVQNSGYEWENGFHCGGAKEFAEI